MSDHKERASSGKEAIIQDSEMWHPNCYHNPISKVESILVENIKMFDPEFEPTKLNELFKKAMFAAMEEYKRQSIEEKDRELETFKDAYVERNEKCNQLQQEIERLKGLIKKSWFGNGMDCECESCMAAFNKFKIENNL